MKQRLRKCCQILCGCLLVGLLAAAECATPVYAAGYSDIEGHWAQATIEKWSDSGILAGYPDGTFKPDQTVVRSELSAILYRVWGSMTADSYFSYPDVKKGDWCYDSLSTMNAYGIALNDGNAMKPNESLTREEAAYMIAKTFFIGMDRNEFTDGHTLYLRKVKDYKKISGEYSGRISDMLNGGYITGYPDGSLGPQDPITRAQVLTIINKMAGNFISSPGVYDINMGDRVVVTCDDVTINIKKVGDSVSNVYAYLMNEAALGGVTFAYDGTESVKVGVSYVSAGETTCKTRGNVICSKGASFVKDVSPMPDTRYGGGQGTELFPYVVSSAEHLALLAEEGHKASSRQEFVLDRDLDLGTITEPFSAGEEFISANLDGNGHTITYNMSGKTDRPFSGLFESWRGACSDLTIKGTIDLTVADKEKKAPAFGGFAGYLQGEMTNCISLMDICIDNSKDADTLEVGGLVGFALASDLTNCKAGGTVEVTSSGSDTTISAGGLVGNAAVVSGIYPGVKLIGCSAEGTVTVTGGYQALAGGLVGGFAAETDHSQLRERNFGLIENCWSKAAVSGSGASFQIDCGGLAGQVVASAVKSSWAKPTLSVSNSSLQNLGGIAGACYENGSITNCWANAEGVGSGGDIHAGGIVGRLRGSSVSNCYVLSASALGSANAIVCESWNDGVVDSSYDFTGKSKAQIDTVLQSSGWDLDRVWETGEPNPTLRAIEKRIQF